MNLGMGSKSEKDPLILLKIILQPRLLNILKPFTSIEVMFQREQVTHIRASCSTSVPTFSTCLRFHTRLSWWRKRQTKKWWSLSVSSSFFCWVPKPVPEHEIGGGGSLELRKIQSLWQAEASRPSRAGTGYINIAADWRWWW